MTADEIMALADEYASMAQFSATWQIEERRNDTAKSRASLRAAVEQIVRERGQANAALLQAQEAAKILLAKGEMLAAVVQGAKEEFVRVPYGASHEDVAAIKDWHRMADEALEEWK